MPIAALFWRLLRKEIIARNQGTVLGRVWLVVQPLIMLAIYTFVFSHIFQARWGTSASASDFALNVFLGMLLHEFFARTLSETPSTITSHPTFVKKIVFPLPILPAINVCTNFFYLCISLCIWFVYALISGHVPPATALLLPLVLLPVLLMALAVSWVLSSMGVFLRDLVNLMPALAAMLLFLSPVFYPLHSLPPYAQRWASLNPLAVAIEMARGLLIQGTIPAATTFLYFTGAASAMCVLALLWFRRVKDEFADAL